MSSSSKNVVSVGFIYLTLPILVHLSCCPTNAEISSVSINWQKVPDKDLEWNEADSKDVALVKLQEKYQHKQAQEAEE
ncbi:hypothetical protein ID866_9241 [Astraeus odoratus]|nr:hypothetical protein ID866_9241 [Astraeus odoratus]